MGVMTLISHTHTHNQIASFNPTSPLHYPSCPHFTVRRHALIAACPFNVMGRADEMVEERVVMVCVREEDGGMTITGDMIAQAAITAFFVVLFIALLGLLFGRWPWPPR